MLKQEKDWEDFLRRITELGYEIKYGKHIAFRHKDKKRFTKAKMIGENYVEERLKETLTENLKLDSPAVKLRVGNVIYIKNNEKLKSSKGYEL